MITCSVFAPLIWVVKQFTSALPDWSTPPATTTMGTCFEWMAKVNHFLPVVELFVLFSIYHAFVGVWLAYRTGRTAVNMIRGCG